MPDTSGPAFPDGDQVDYTGGMTIRQFYAAAAFTGLLARSLGEGHTLHTLAVSAWKAADELLDTEGN